MTLAQPSPSLNGATQQSAHRGEEPRPSIPHGVADYFWGEAYARKRLEHRLLARFRTWGYQDVIPPMFEYTETFEQGASSSLRAEMYRFLDRDGSTLALRPDMTIPVARLVGVRLHDRPMPQRFCYAGSVFRYAAPQAGRQREFTQTGFELIGAAGPAADAEVMALTIDAVRTAGIADFRLAVGHMGYFNGLLQELQLAPAQTATLLAAIDRNSQPELAQFLRETPLRTQQRRAIEELPRLSGADPTAILDHAERLCLNYAMHRALSNLRRIIESLQAYDADRFVYLDLTEIHNLGYYTGITFEVLVPGLGFPVGSGGRYDNLVAAFGADHPAVGVALGIDRILVAQRQTDPLALLATTAHPHLYVVASGNASALMQVNAWRQRGLRVVVAVEDQSGRDLLEAARRQGAALALEWRDAAIWGVDLRGPVENELRPFNRDELERLISQFTPDLPTPRP